MTMRAAIIGLGDIAPTHLSILNCMEDVEVAAVCDTDPAKAASVVGIPFYNKVETLLTEVHPDVVHLCLPHYLHYPIAKLAAEAGVNVFCEKPLANSLVQAVEFARLEAEHPELRFGLCLQNRYNNTTVALQKIIADGRAGVVTGIRAIVTWQRTPEYYASSPWRGMLAQSGGGVMNNQSVHTLDLMGLFGGRADKVRGSICQLLDYGLEVEDTAMASIQFKGGAQGLFIATVANNKNDSVDITVTMEQGEYRIIGGALYCTDDDSLICVDEQPDSGKLYYGNSHGRAIKAFYDSLATGGDDYIHAVDGVESMRLIDAIRRSSAATAEERTVKV